MERRACLLLALAASVALLLPLAVATNDCCKCLPTCTSSNQGANNGNSCGSSETCVKRTDNSQGDCKATNQLTGSDVALNSQCAAPSSGDPVLAGFDGSSFELVGEAGKWFNLISEATHNINTYLVGANMSSKATGGTLMGAVAIKYGKHEIEASVDPAGALTVVVDGETISAETLNNAHNKARELELGDDASVVVELYRANYGHSMHIITPLLDMTFFVTLPGLDDYYQEYLPAYLNFYMGMKDPSVSGIHGLLGQTAPKSFAAKPKTLTASSSAAIDLFSGEGEESDYIVDGAFATDFKFSQYGKAAPKQQVLKIARRSMIETSAPTVFATYSSRPMRE